MTGKMKMLACAGAMLIAALSQATLFDTSIIIDRAANNKTLTVRYDGAAAALIELRINGVSVASRVLDEKTSEGETNFPVDVAALEDGENKVEIRLYDKNGKLLGTQKSTLSVDRLATGPVTLLTPAKNDTVQGITEIKVGFRTELKNVYVSFFVNDDFKVLKNFPPYAYLWDTRTVPNGWHEVQAWIVDESNATFKTEKLRLYVNNPGGQTKREPVDPRAEAIKNAGTKPVEKPKADLKAPTDPKVTGAVASKTSGTATGTRAMNPGGNTAKPTTEKPIVIAIDGSSKNPPTPKVDPPVVKKNDDLVAKTTPKEAPKLKPVLIDFGTRLPDMASMPIYMNGEMVTFDVNPRVSQGVALTPFRHLFEHNGGKVKWDHEKKMVQGLDEALSISFTIGDPTARVNGSSMMMEMAPFIERGRSIIPLSFFSQALNVDVQFDPVTGHVLILSAKSK